MDPRVKTFLKVLLGAVSGSAASVFANPDNFVAFGSIAGILTAAGALLASYLEKLGSAA